MIIKHKTVFEYATWFGLFLISLVSQLSNAQSLDGQNPLSRFDSLKQTIFEVPYQELPNYKVSLKTFGRAGKSDDNKLLVAARRTLNDERDLIDFAGGQKLLQANGICFTGTWQIDAVDNPYTGLYEKGIKIPVIVRASVALSGTLQKDKRAFAMAIKFLPNDLGDDPSLNVFVMNTFGGVVSKHVVDLPMDNQPTLGRIPKFSDIRTALRMRSELERADKEAILEDGVDAKPRATFRPVSHLAAYREDQPSSPQWLRLTAVSEYRNDQDDFRDELRLETYPDNQLVYAVEAADLGSGRKNKAQWRRLGQLILNESVTSLACDQKLHFQHTRLSGQ